MTTRIQHALTIAFSMALALTAILMPTIYSNARAADAATAKATLPLVIYSDGQATSGYIPSGWMGNPSAIKYNPNCTTHARNGATACLKIAFTASDGWGGIAWQNPANNWGKMQGGFDLTGAKKLVFWARGKTGGEQITFGYGLIGKNQPFHDSSKGAVKVTLTKHWKKYAISLKDKDMSSIVTGFFWTAGAKGSPFTFYLDGVKYN